MNTSLTDDAQAQSDALSRYHARYSNVSYLAVQVAIIADLYDEVSAQDSCKREQALAELHIAEILNLVVDVSLEICGYPFIQNKRKSLCNALLNHPISDKTIKTVARHLAIFEGNDTTIVADFENTLLALLKVRDARAELVESLMHSSDIHGTNGRAAHYLVKATIAFLHTAELVLKGEESQSYLNEKLGQGASTLADALEEMQQA